MKHEISKVTRIIDEIVSYFLYKVQCPRFGLNYTQTGEACILEFTFYCTDIAPETITYIRNKLKGRRQPELEDYYWQLTGDAEDDNELALVSMMVDEARLEYGDGGETIRLCLRRNR
ncbi:MAG: hypothetical protein ACLFU6_07695 [Candidatus Hydrogenedentota bacterium]